MFLSNYAYILFYKFYVLKLVVCHWNRSIGHIACGENSLDNGTRLKEKEGHERRKEYLNEF